MEGGKCNIENSGLVNDAITRYIKEANLPVAEDVFEVRLGGRVPQAPERLAD